MTPPPQQRNIRLWALYDAANSLSFSALSLFFGVWFVNEYGSSDAWMSLSMAVTTIILLIFLPVLGRYSDVIGRRMPFIAVATFLSGGALICLGIVANGAAANTTMTTLTIFLLYSLFNITFMGSFAFYDALLRSLSKERSLDALSSFGSAVGQAGWVAGLLLVYPIASGMITFPGFHGKPAAFVVGGAAFLLCSLPTLLFFREDPPPENQPTVALSVRATLRDLANLRKIPGALPYLCCYALFADALLTLELFAVLYLETVGHLTGELQTIVFLIALISGVPGAACAPLLVRMIGSTRRTIALFLGGWMAALAVFAAATGPLLMSVCLIFTVFALGVLFALSRSFYARMIPRDQQAEMFGVYTVFERTASFVGPALWSVTAVLFSSFGPDKYRFSVLALALMIALSLMFLRRVPEQENTTMTKQR